MNLRNFSCGIFMVTCNYWHDRGLTLQNIYSNMYCAFEACTAAGEDCDAHKKVQ